MSGSFHEGMYLGEAELRARQQQRDSGQPMRASEFGARSGGRMRRVFSQETGRALFSSVGRSLIVCACLLGYFLAGTLLGPVLPWWVVTLAGLILFAFLVYLGTVWADRDLLRRAQNESP